MANRANVFVTNGASNHTDEERARLDYYATDPRAVELLLQLEDFQENIWEPACGGGHISQVLEAHGYNVRSSDVEDYGFKGTELLDFLQCEERNKRDIITNPPYAKAADFVWRALDISEDGVKIAMFLKLTFLEGQGRRELFQQYPPRTVYVSSSRLQCVKNGDFEGYKDRSSAVAYAWFIWEKGTKRRPVIKWFN